MQISLKNLEAAIAVRRQIDRLEARLSLLLGGSAPRDGAGQSARPRRRMSAAARAKIAAAARARWAARRGEARKAKGKKGGGITPAGRRKLSRMMKVRWAARRRGAKKSGKK